MGRGVSYVGVVLGTCVTVACGQTTGADLNRQGDPSGNTGGNDSVPAPTTSATNPVPAPTPSADAGPSLPVPDCGAVVKTGDVRAVVPDVIGRVAVDSFGNVYAPRQKADGELWLTAVDACGTILWERVGAATMPQSPATARLVSDDEVVLEAVGDRPGSGGISRFETHRGDRRDSVQFAEGATAWVAATADGVFFRSHDASTGISAVSRTDAAGPVTRALGVIDDIDEESCAAYGSRVACHSIAFDARSMKVLWSATGYRILDGTYRHTATVALDADRLYGVEYGVSSYHLVVRATADGTTLFERDLGRSPSGQDGLVIGTPVIGEDGAIFVYVSHRARTPPDPTPGLGDGTTVPPPTYVGGLVAFERDGTQRWSFDAPSETEQFHEHATHVLGRDGAIYLATTHAIRAIDARTGALRWQSERPTTWTPRIALSPNGDLLVQDRTNELSFIATESGGPAHSAWPVPGGSPANLNGR